MGFFVQLIIGVLLSIASYLLQPKPKQPKPPGLKDFDTPTAESGRPIPVVFGSITVTGPNIIMVRNKRIRDREVEVESK